MTTRYIRNRDGREVDANEALAGGVLRDGYGTRGGVLFMDSRPTPLAGDRFTVRDLDTLGKIPDTVPKSLTSGLAEIARRLRSVTRRDEAKEILHAVELEHNLIRVGLEKDRQYAAMGQIVGTPDEIRADHAGREAALAWLETIHSVLSGSLQAFQDAALADANATAQARAHAAYDAGREDLSNAWRQGR